MPTTAGSQQAQPASARVSYQSSPATSAVPPQPPDPAPAPGGPSSMSAATATAQSARTGGFLGFIERAGNNVPHPVLMFLYLIIGVIVLSSVLAFAGVSVTDTIVVPDTVDVVPNYYEDSTEPILEPSNLDYQGDFHL